MNQNDLAAAVVEIAGPISATKLRCTYQQVRTAVTDTAWAMWYWEALCRLQADPGSLDEGSMSSWFGVFTATAGDAWMRVVLSQRLQDALAERGLEL